MCWVEGTTNTSMSQSIQGEGSTHSCSHLAEEECKLLVSITLHHYYINIVMFICYSPKYCRETSVCRAVCTFSSLKFVWTLLFVFQFESQSSNYSVKLCASLASSQQLSVNQYYYCKCLCNICFLNEATCGCSCQTDIGSKPICDE